MNFTCDPVTGYPAIQKQGFQIILQRDINFSEANQLYDWLQDDYEDLKELPRMFREVECVMTRSGTVIS